MARLPILVLSGALLCGVAGAQGVPATATSDALAPPANGSMTDLEVETMFKRGVLLIAESKWAEALPLLQQAVAQRPSKGVYQEQLGRCLVGRGASLDGEARLQMRKEAYQAFLQARNLGDNSNLVQIMLEELGAILKAGPAKAETPTPYTTALAEAEKAFNQGDFAGSIPLYEKAMAIDPTAYGAPLYAGDAAYKAGRYPEAFQFYARAVAIQPNAETAYRYWGDALMKARQTDAAEDKFIDALVAQPYLHSSQVGLRQWAQQTNHVMAGPEIHLRSPSLTRQPNGQIQVGVVPGAPDDPNNPAWIAYQVRQVAPYLPNRLTPPRRTLADETAAIRDALKTASSVPPDKLDPSFKLLKELDGKGMLESWILLFDVNGGITQDYDSYRDAHRPVLTAFVREYVIHPK